MNRWVMLGFILAFLVLPSIAFSVKANPETIVVPDDYPTIQSAIDAVQDGAVIHVKSGVYHENLKVNKSISLIGESYDLTIIDGNSSEGYRVPCRIKSDNVTVSGFTLRDSWGGVQLWEVSGCNISGNRMNNNQYGIMLGSASGNRLIGNIIDSVELGYGIYLLSGSNNVIEGNWITSSAEGIAVIDELLRPDSVMTSKNNSILGNTIANCTDKAMWFKFTKENFMVGNTIANSTIGLALLETDNNTIYKNNFIHNAKQVAGGPEPIWSGGSGIRYSICQWDNGEEGNYWSDYNGTDANYDGIGDTPYVINEKNKDNAPLMNPLPISDTFPSPTPPNQDSFSTWQVIAVLSALIVAIIGLFLYFRQYKR